MKAEHLPVPAGPQIRFDVLISHRHGGTKGTQSVLVPQVRHVGGTTPVRHRDRWSAQESSAHLPRLFLTWGELTTARTGWVHRAPGPALVRACTACKCSVTDRACPGGLTVVQDTTPSASIRTLARTGCPASASRAPYSALTLPWGQ